MRLAIVIPPDLRHEVALIVASAAGIEELRAEGCAVLDLGQADDRLGDGVAPVRQLMPIWTIEPELLHDLNERLSGPGGGAPQRGEPAPRLGRERLKVELDRQPGEN
jgi:hypothetical protein